MQFALLCYLQNNFSFKQNTALFSCKTVYYSKWFFVLKYDEEDKVVDKDE